MIPTRDLLRLTSETLQPPDDDFSLDALAKRAGWSKFYLHRSFRHVLGETPKQYSLRLRLERAAARLSTNGDSVLTVALAAGFTGHEVFTRAFRRHFGCSPTEYRAKALPGVSAADRNRHADVVRTAGPCVGLYHVRLDPRGEPPIMSPTITRQELQEQPILYIRRKLAQSDLQPFFSECFMKLYGHGMRAGLAIAGQPMARYISIGPGLWTVDAVLPLAQPAEGEGEIEAGTLRGGPAAVAVHMGPYEALQQTYVAIEKWAEENGAEPAGAPWEQYVTDPGKEPDPANWRTDVYMPLVE